MTKKKLICKRCGSEYPEELASRFDNLCEVCVPIAVKDIMAEWWDCQDPLDQDEMIESYVENLL